MSIQIAGRNAVVFGEGGGASSTFFAEKVQNMPVDYGPLGCYSKSFLSGTMAAGLGAGSTIFSWRWTDATRICLIHDIVIDGLAGSATAFTAGFGNLRVFPARSFSVSDSGGTAGTFTTNNGKFRTAMGTSLMASGDARISSTTNLTVGTRTLDADPIGQMTLTFGTVVSVQYLTQPTILVSSDFGAVHPFMLVQNEGFIIQGTVPATGTWQFGVTVRWSEVASY